MSRLLPLVVVVLAACGGGPTATPGPGQTTAVGQTPGPAATAGPAATVGPGATLLPPPGGVTIPEACAAGFVEYLKAIEPVVSGFDPATSTLGDFFTTDQAASEKGVELLVANDGNATYSCSEVGLEFAYFDARSPWAAIHQVASANAPGTEPYLQVNERVAALDNTQLSDFGAATCADASGRIKEAVSGLISAGTASAEDMPVEAGIDLLGLYRAYLNSVADGTCPDVLGNDEFDFFGSIG